MQEVVQALSQFVVAFWALLVAIGRPLLPWIPLAAWVAFWLFAVNWVRLRETLAKGGWVGLVLLGALAVLVWGTIAPTPGGTREVFGLHVSNFVEKTVYVSALAVIAFLAGSVQLSGCCSSCCRFDEEEPEGHGHDTHGHHSHDDPAHGAAVAVAHH